MDIQSNDQQDMYFRPLDEHANYKDKIRVLLNQLMMNPKLTIKQLVNTLGQFKFYSTGTQLSQDISYRYLQSSHLQKELNTPVVQLFSKMARIVLQTEGAFKQRKIKILSQGKNDSIQFTKNQMLYLMSLMALNLVPTQPYAQNEQIRQNYSFANNFSFIFSHHVYKCQAVLNYFAYHFNNPFWEEKKEKFVIRRKCLRQNIEQVMNKKGSSEMIPYSLKGDNESIETFSGCGKVDFANQYIGGGALHMPCVQEQIMFANSPEMFVSMIFCQVMDERQSLCFQGFKKYSNNKGYGRQTQFDKEYKIDHKNFYSLQQHVVAIDAICYPSPNEQFRKKLIDRQLTKAYSGFSNLHQNVNLVVTGNWGCGAFGGQITVKFIIQWLACSLAGKKMIYCPFGSSFLIKQSQQILNELNKCTIQKVYKILLEAGKHMKNGETNIFKRIEKQI